MATMAATRQPFAPIEGSRLQNLTSLKNRQNAISSLTSPTKRKATTFEDDSENVDPIIFLSPKKSKNADGSAANSKESIFQKPINYFLTNAPPSPIDLSNSFKPTPSPRRPILTARSPAPRLNTSAIQKSTPLSAPAGRSPTRKRIGILNRRRTTTSTPFTRVEPPKFHGPSLGSSLGFSIDAALSGTIPSYKPREKLNTSNTINENEPIAIPQLYTPAPRESWFFAIHEDTEEELATNLMEHSTCTLDISSDEESVARMRDERGKENVPPLDDVSQTRTVLHPSSSSSSTSLQDSNKPSRISSRRRRDADLSEGAIELDRSALGELVAEDFYAEGCDGSSVFIVPSEEDESGSVPVGAEAFEFSAGQGEVEAEAVMKEEESVEGEGALDIDDLMRKDDYEAPRKAALLMPIEKAEEGFEVWESSSAKDEAEECSC